MKKEEIGGWGKLNLCPKSLSLSLQQQSPGRGRAFGRRRARGRIRTDMERKENRGRRVGKTEMWAQRKRDKERLVGAGDDERKSGEWEECQRQRGEERKEDRREEGLNMSASCSTQYWARYEKSPGVSMAYRTTAALDATGLKIRTCPSCCTLASFLTRESRNSLQKVHTEYTLQRRWIKLAILVSGLNIAVHDRHSFTGGRNHCKIRKTLLPGDLNVFKCYLSQSDESPLCFYCNPACWISASLPPPRHLLLVHSQSATSP